MPWTVLGFLVLALELLSNEEKHKVCQLKVHGLMQAVGKQLWRNPCLDPSGKLG
jgi:hypothetical protein